MQTEETTSLCDIRYKIVFLGEMGVGKSSVIERFVKDEFDGHNNPTVGIDFLSRSFAYKGRVYRLQLWDTAGQEKYRSLVPAYLRDANCAVFVFDLSRLETLDNLKNWLQLYRDHQPETSIGMLVGNKSDLMVNVPADMEERIDTFAKHEGLHYWKVSAKEGNGITDLFRAIVELLFDSSPNQKGELGMGNQFVLQERQQKIKDPIGCCHI